MTAHQIQVGGGDLRPRVLRLLGGLLAHRLRIGVLHPLKQLGLRETQFRLAVARVIGQYVLVCPDRPAQVPRVQGLYGGLQQRVVRTGRNYGRRLGAGAGLGVRVDGQTGEPEPLLGDGHQLVEGLPDLRLARGALEERERLAGDDGEHSGDPLHPELLHQHLVGVDVDLGKEEAAVVLDGEPLQDGAELLAGLAPLGPEVDDDRDLGGALKYVPLEPGLIDIDDEVGGGDGPSPALPGRFGARLLRLRLGLLGRLHRGEVDDSAHGHVPWLHASILPRSRARVKSDEKSCLAEGPHPTPVVSLRVVA